MNRRSRFAVLALAVLAALLAIGAAAWLAISSRGGIPRPADHDLPAAGSFSQPPIPNPQSPIPTLRRQLIGVRTAPVERQDLARIIRAAGVVRYDETRLSDINLKLTGWIDELYVDYTGQFVRKDQPLFTLYSPDLVTTQNEYLLALRARERLAQSPVAGTRDYADRLVESARRRLALWDLPAEQIAALDETREPQRVLLFRSPVDGFVLEKRVVKGMHVAAGESLYRIADLAVVWVEADVYERELPVVRTGQRATVTLEAYPGERFSGRVAYIHPFVEEKTRTVRVRLLLANPRGRLKPGMYASVELGASLGRGLTVPANALLDSGTRRVVFVELGDGSFEPRPVEVGQRLGERVQILGGLREGEVVASGAAFFLDSESQLRASLESFEAAPADTGPEAGRERVTVAFRSDPDPPRSGRNAFEVVVKDSQGRPVTDAGVTVVFFMPAMPTMNMPAMRSEAALAHAGDGVYRGTGEVMMAGRWDVSVNVVRAGQPLGSTRLTVVAR